MKHLKFAWALGVVFSGAASATDAPPKVDEAYIPYEQVGMLVKTADGQTIHVKCMGSGTPTVVLTAGLGDWSAAWRKVQPQIAKTTRVCAWDRPGYGFSSGTLKRQTVMDTTATLEAALKQSRIGGPYIMVGHSLGGYETLLFKDRNPRAVVGMVLVDSSMPDQHARIEKAAPQFSAWSDTYMASGVAMYGRCLDGLKTGKLKVGSPDPDGCLQFSPDYPPTLARALAAKDTNPLRFNAARSLVENFAESSTLVANPNRNYRDMPLVVLTATKDPELPPSGPSQDQMEAVRSEWQLGHKQLTTLSSRGSNYQVPGAGHYIQNDQPQAVIDAVNTVVATARNGRR